MRAKGCHNHSNSFEVIPWPESQSPPSQFSNAWCYFGSIVAMKASDQKQGIRDRAARRGTAEVSTRLDTFRRILRY